MGQGTDNLERVNRTYAGEFDGEGYVQRLARDAAKANRQTAKRAARVNRRNLAASHAAALRTEQ